MSGIPADLFIYAMTLQDLDPVEVIARVLAHKDGHDPDGMMAIKRATDERMPPMRRAWTWYIDEASAILGSGPA
jgi:hypothetical protein